MSNKKFILLFTSFLVVFLLGGYSCKKEEKKETTTQKENEPKKEEVVKEEKTPILEMNITGSPLRENKICDETYFKLKVKNTSKISLKYEDIANNKYEFLLEKMCPDRTIEAVTSSNTWEDFKISTRRLEVDNFGEIKKDEEKILTFNLYSISKYPSGSVSHGPYEKCEEIIAKNDDGSMLTKAKGIRTPFSGCELFFEFNDISEKDKVDFISESNGVKL